MFIIETLKFKIIKRREDDILSKTWRGTFFNHLRVWAWRIRKKTTQIKRGLLRPRSLTSRIMGIVFYFTTVTVPISLQLLNP